MTLNGISDHQLVYTEKVDKPETPSQPAPVKVRCCSKCNWEALTEELQEAHGMRLNDRKIVMKLGQDVRCNTLVFWISMHPSKPSDHEIGIFP